MLNDLGFDDLIWIEGNTFCCLCGWWHNSPKDYGHEPLLCPTCLVEYLALASLPDRDTSVTPAREKPMKKGG